MSRTNHRAPLLVLALLVVVALAGCKATLSPRWVDLAQVRAPSRLDHPDHGAVVLLQEVTALNVARRNGWYQEWLWHSVVAILDDRGLDEGTFRCHRAPGAEIVAFHARVRTPSGEVREVDDDDLFEQPYREADGDESGEVRTVVVPGVEVGSVVELVCLEHQDQGIFLRETFRPRTDLPVAKYSVEITISDSLRAAVHGYGTREPITRTEGRDSVTYRWSLQDLPARENEPDMVHWTEREPWWVYRTLAFKSGSAYKAYQRSWPEVVRDTAIRLDAAEEPLTAGAPPAPNVRHCHGDVRCIAGVLFTEVLHLAEPRWPDSPRRPRPLEEALATGRLTPSERTVLLVQWLRQSGVAAQHALLADRFGFHLDHEFPNDAAFSTLVAYVPADPGHGLEKPLWLDPRCETCAAGELSPAALGTDALVLRAEKQLVTSPVVEGSMHAVTGPKGEVGRILRAYAVKVSDTGDATVDFEEQFDGLQAWWWWLDHRDRAKGRWRSDARRRLRGLDPRIHLESEAHRIFDRVRATAGQTLTWTLPGLGARDGDLLVVPLGVLDRETRYDHAEALARKTDIARVRPATELDLMNVVPPPGFVVAELPPPVKATSSLAELSFEAVTRPDGVVHVTRRLELRPGRYPKSDEPSIRAVYEAADALRRAVVVFRRSTGQADSAMPAREPVASGGNVGY